MSRKRDTLIRWSHMHSTPMEDKWRVWQEKIEILKLSNKNQAIWFWVQGTSLVFEWHLNLFIWIDASSCVCASRVEQISLIRSWVVRILSRLMYSQICQLCRGRLARSLFQKCILITSKRKPIFNIAKVLFIRYYHTCPNISVIYQFTNVSVMWHDFSINPLNSWQLSSLCCRQTK